MSFIGKLAKGALGGAIAGPVGAAVGATAFNKKKKPAAPAKKPAIAQAASAFKRQGPMDSTPPSPKPKLSLAQKMADTAKKKKGSLTGFSLR